MQPAHTATATYCKENKLNVNPSKSKIVIFSRGKVRKYHVFDFDGASLQCTGEYNYLQGWGQMEFELTSRGWNWN